jgi:hypothetical protein
MDEGEARSLLVEFLADLKNLSREELLGLVADPTCLEKTGTSGAVYQIEYQAVLDSEPGRALPHRLH